MTPARLQGRAAFVLGLVLVALLALLGRLAQIQLVDHERWLASAEDKHRAPAVTIAAERGRILDRNGEVLALTDRVPSVAVDPSLVEDRARLERVLRQSLGVTPTEFAAALERGGRRFAYVRRHVEDLAGIERLRALREEHGLRELVFLPEPRRVYPGGPLAAHVLGFTDIDGRGLEGVERLVDARLQGTAGKRRARRDGRGRRIGLAGPPLLEPVPGEDVRLTLDAVVQTFAEQAAQEAFERWSPKRVVVAAADVQSGEILGLACRPAYDPNRPGEVAAVERRNPFFTDVFVPGSTFKPIVMGIALAQGVVRPGDAFDCSGGRVRVGSRVVREDEYHDYGPLDATGVIARSSNVGMVKVGQLVGIQAMYDGVRRFGIGSPTGLGWPGESRGLMTPLRHWTRPYTLCSVSFGHEMAVTPAQLLRAYMAIANGGELPALRLLLDAPPSGKPERALDADAVAQLVPMMEEVLLTGTGRRCRLPDYRIAGKTGTAQKLTGAELAGHIGSFGCFGPVESPRVAVLVICDEPQEAHYGSVVAAPYATRLLRRSLRYLGVPSFADALPPPPEPVLRAEGTYSR